MGGEHGLETRVFDVDLDTQTAESSTEIVKEMSGFISLSLGL